MVVKFESGPFQSFRESGSNWRGEVEQEKCKGECTECESSNCTSMSTVALSTDDAVEGLLALASPCVFVTRCSNESDEVYTSVQINPLSDASLQTNIPSCSDISVETDIFSYGKVDV